MNDAKVSAHDVAFILAVVAGAMIYPPLALVVGAAWLAVTVVVADRRSAPLEQPEGAAQPHEFGPGVR